MPSGNVDEWDEYYRTQSVAVHPDLFVVRRFAKESAIPMKRVLIFACGAGRNAIWLAKRGLYVMATDQSKEALEKVKWWARTEGVEGSVDVLQHDLLAGDESYDRYLGSRDYDFVIFEGCLEYFDDEQVLEVLRRSRRCMRLTRGGRVFIFARGPSHWAHQTTERSDGWMKTYPREDFWYAQALSEELDLDHFEVTNDVCGTTTFQGLTKAECQRWSDDLYLEGWR